MGTNMVAHGKTDHCYNGSLKIVKPQLYMFKKMAKIIQEINTSEVI